MRCFRWIGYLFCATFAHAEIGYLTYAAGLMPIGVTAVDLNGDRWPDVVVANTGSNSLSILLNDGSGGFTALPPLNIELSAPRAVVAADLNGDGKIDLVATGTAMIPLPQGATGAGLVVLLGNGDGTFQAPRPVSGCSRPTSLQVADLNGDAVPDLAVTCLTSGFLVPVGASVEILPGNGDGTFGAGTTYGLLFTPWAVLTIGDFNQDGKPDVEIATGGSLTVLLNDGKANFHQQASTGEPWNFSPGIAAGDFNGDGVLDLAVSGQARTDLARGTVTILLGKGDGTFQVSTVLQTTGFGQLAAMDLNGDGKMDLVEGLSTVTFFAGHGDGTFESGRPFGGSRTGGFFALADFTGSGVMGFAGVQSYLTPTLQIAGNATILPRAEWPSLALANVSAAGYGLGPLAPGSIVTAFGQNLTTQTAQASGALPVLLGGVAVSVTDSSRVARPAQLYYVSPGQVNYLIPPDTAAGLATVSITANGITAASGPIEVATVAPSLFTVNADGLAAANAVRVSENGDQTFEPIYQTDQNGNITALPIDLGSDTDAVYLVLYGTGIRNVGRFSAASATIGGRFEAPLGYLGAQATYAGLDQVNIQLPKLLASPLAQTWGIQLMAGGQPSNQVTVLIQGVARAPGGSIRSGRLPSGRVARRGARGHS